MTPTDPDSPDATVVIAAPRVQPPPTATLDVPGGPDPGGPTTDGTRSADDAPGPEPDQRDGDPPDAQQRETQGRGTQTRDATRPADGRGHRRRGGGRRPFGDALVIAAATAPPGQVRTEATTPARLRRTMAVLVLALLVWAGVAGWLVSDRSAAVDRLVNRAEPLTVSVTGLYGSLQDADAAAAASFLTVGANLPGSDGARARYQDDLGAAGQSVALIATAVGQDSASVADVTVLTTQLPVYAGLVETARDDRAGGLPVAAAYQREASTLMNDQLLPAVDRLHHEVSASLDDDTDAATSTPWAVLVLGPLAVVVLIGGQVLLARRTRRMFNVGLLLATAATAAAVGWTISGLLDQAEDMTRSRTEGSASVEVLTSARIEALQARGSELLTVVSGGEDHDGVAPTVPGMSTHSLYEQSFNAAHDRLISADGTTGLLADARRLAWDDAQRALVDQARTDLAAWTSVHQTIVDDEDAGVPARLSEATLRATTDADARFGALDTDLTRGVARARAAFDQHAADGRADTDGILLGIIVLAVVGLGGVVAGYAQRLREYR